MSGPGARPRVLRKTWRSKTKKKALGVSSQLLSFYTYRPPPPNPPLLWSPGPGPPGGSCVLASPVLTKIRFSSPRASSILLLLRLLLFASLDPSPSPLLPFLFRCPFRHSFTISLLPRLPRLSSSPSLPSLARRPVRGHRFRTQRP